jgi:hypothetical protein
MIKDDRSAYRINGKRAMGFAALGEAERSAIAGIGGKRAHELGRAHTWTSGEEAQAAGRKGGAKSHRKREQPRTCNGCGVEESASTPFVGKYRKCKECHRAHAANAYRSKRTKQ